MKGIIIATFAAIMLVTSASAQTMSSTAELKFACETSPNNVVFLTNNTQISTGPQSPLTENVNTKCTIELAPNVTFEASQVSMTFAGPLRINGQDQSRALFLESHFSSPFVTVALANLGELLVERSLLKASVGAIAVTAGVESRVDVRGPIVGGGLEATRSLTISGGNKLAVSITDSEIRTGGAINVSMNGVESSFVSTTSSLNTNGAAINIIGAGEKSYAEFKLGSAATGRAGVNVTLNGNESVIVASQFAFNSPAGAVLLRTGGNKGEVAAAVGTINAGGVVNIQSSMTGLEGKAAVQDATINSGRSIRIETGSRGNTEAKDSSLSGTNLVRIATGAGGSCLSQNNLFTTLAIQACP